MAIAQIQIKSLQQLLGRRQEVTAGCALPVGLPDCAVYYFVKEGSFLSKKEERWMFYFFQGLNTNPQNMSIYLRDQAQRENRGGKQKLTKGVFVIFDLFSRSQVVIEINIPGHLRIFKLVDNKKQLVSNQEIDLMYLSSVFRSMYQINLPWGRSYLLFHDSKNYGEELKAFLGLAFRMLMKRDLNFGGEFEGGARVKGSHCCSLIFAYLRERRLVGLAIELIEQLFSKNDAFKRTPKYGILLSELYMQFGKPSKSLQIIFFHLSYNPHEVYLLYYQSRYLLQSGLYEQALLVGNSIVQYNQFQIWLLLGQIHLELKHFGQLLICLNYAMRLAKIKSNKNGDWGKSFEELGKIRHNSLMDGLEYNPRLLVYTDTPLSIMVKDVEEKNKFLIERGYWRLNQNEKVIYGLMQEVRYRLESKKFEEILINTFEDHILKFQQVAIKKGMTEPVTESPTVKLAQESSRLAKEEEEDDNLPDFLKNSIDKVEESVSMKPSRNLSIIPEIESVIENSNYQQREKEKAGRHVKLRREVSEGLFRIVQLVLGEGEFEKAQYQNNVGKILQVYNKMRTSSKFNNYYADLMFKIFMQTSNYKSIIVLIAQTLDFLQQRGVRRMDKMPYWMHKYLFFIIEEKGLKFLNEMLSKLNFYDQAIVDTIEMAKGWRMKGVTY